MQDIDFLPVEYRQRRTRCMQQRLRNVATGLVGIVAVAAACYQQLAVRQATRKLTEVMPRYESALKQTEKLGRLQSELEAARVDAELFTYLRHPWPKTQIIHALVTALPEEIRFTRLEICRQPQAMQRHSDANPLAALSSQAGASALQPPAALDLTRLRQQFDSAQTIVSVEGTTSESSALHDYLSALNRSGLFTRADLESLEADRRAEQAVLRFQATLVVRPGYGLPGGPDGPLPQPLAPALQEDLRHL